MKGSTEGLALLIDLGEKYAVEVGSKAGKEFILEYKKLFENANSGIKKLLLKIKKNSTDSVKLR